MRYTRSIKHFKVLYLILGIAMTLIIGVAYAILNTTLSINGIAEISKNTWDVHFENIVVKEGNVTPTSEATISDTGTEITFNIPLSKPGDNYSFEVDIVNNGTIDAKLGEILKTGLTAENKKYLIFDVNYKDGALISDKDALRASSKDTISVTVGYDMNIENDELVSTDESVELSLKMSYVQDDGSAIDVDSTVFRLAKVQAVSDNISSEYVTSSNGISFTDISSDTNGKGIYTLASTINDNYPIHYYRGAVETNNVLFAGFCWKIVRTTETGGTKLVYNGLPDNNGACTATGADSTIGDSLFNSGSFYEPLGSAGYMYGDSYVPNYHWMHVQGFTGQSGMNSWSENSSNYIYSDSVTYDSTTGLYTLVDGENRVWKDTYMNQGNLHKYTCLSEDSNTCKKLYYVVGSNYASCITVIWFTGGRTADATAQMGVVYGKNATYDSETGMYTLTDTTAVKVIDWIKDYEKIMGENGYRYTCFNDSDTCSEVKYIYYYTEEEVGTDVYNATWYVTLKDGAIDPLAEFTTNTNDSTIKTTIDTWYKNNMTEYTSMLEDTVWCNDRSISDYAGWKNDSSGVDNYLKFSSYNRSRKTYTPTLICPNKNDAFTVDDTTSGNGALTYPVGLLTLDEAMYSGVSYGKENNTFYLYNGNRNWLFSPSSYGFRNPYIALQDSNGNVLDYSNSDSYGVRPAISLKHGITYTSGKGTKESPYVIEKQ